MAANRLSTYASAIQTAAIHRYCGLSLWSTVGCVYRGKNAFCNEAKDGDEMMLWVNRVISSASLDYRFSPESDRIAALH
jgi:hypothetical protein